MSMYIPGSLKSNTASNASSSITRTPLNYNMTPPLVATSASAEVVRPMSPRQLSPRAVNNSLPISPRSSNARLSEVKRGSMSPRQSSSILKKVESTVSKFVTMKRESNDINIVVDKIMVLIDKYDNNSEILEILKVHRWEHANKVLWRAAMIYATRWQIKEVLVVLAQFHHLEYFGDEVLLERGKLIAKIIEHYREAKHDKWVTKLSKLLE